MAVLDKESFFNKLHEKVGNDTSEESITFLEDMTDTYNDLQKKANGDGVDWEKKYHELDETWKAKYRHRFFTSDGGNYEPPSGQNSDEDEYDPEAVTINSLFTTK